MKKLLLVICLTILASPAFSRDDIAKFDANRIPAALGITLGGELRMIKTDSNGVLLSSPAVSGASHVIVDSGTISTVPSIFTIIQVGTAAVTNAGVTCFFSGTGNKSSFVCNESTNTMRMGPATITTDIGLLLQDSTCMTLDGPEIFTGNFCAIGSVASNQKISWLIGK